MIKLTRAVLIAIMGMVSLYSYGQNGCTAPAACNYDPFAVIDDGTCLWTIDCAGNCGGTYVLDACGNCYDPNAFGQVQFNYTGGLQSWEVPAGVTSVVIDVYGAQGGTIGARTGGLGAHIQGEVSVTPGDMINILVGQQGNDDWGSGASGGGGGSYVATAGNIPLVVAGGGSGATDFSDGNPGVITESGTAGDNCANNGGVNGNGGGDSASCGSGSGGGGGFFTDGASGGGWGYQRGQGYINGGAGGPSGYGGAVGGYGGGAGTHTNNTGGGAGGGYSGGGAPYHGNGYSGGGGGSYIIGGVSLLAEEGVRTGNGLVIISYSEIPDCVLGCTDPNADNYNPDATNDDGSCSYDFGCMDVAACNYEPLAIFDDGSCAYVFDCNGVCGGNWWINPCGDCADPDNDPCIGGCMIVGAYNYNPDADYDDGSCTVMDCPQGDYQGAGVVTFTKSFGDPTDEIIPGIEITRGSCSGIYNPLFGGWNGTGPTGTEWKIGDFLSGYAYNNWRNGIHYANGQPLRNNLQSPDFQTTMRISALGYYFDVIWHSWGSSCNGAFSYTRTFLAAESGCEEVPLVAGCDDPEAQNYDINANFDDGTCIYAGCTDPNAYNYNPLATIEDGSCTVLDCVDEEGYNGAAVVEFSKANFADPNSNADYLFSDVQLARGNSRGLYNVVTEPAGWPGCCPGYPTGTEWKRGDYNSGYAYGSWYNAARNQYGYPVSGNLTGGNQMTLHVPSHGAYFDIRWNSWSQGNQGGFSYTRTFLAAESGCVEVPLVYGCNSPNACNWDPAATYDDGSCIFGGCQDPAACNWDPGAACDDGSCAYTLDCSGVCGGNWWVNPCGNCVDPDNDPCIGGCMNVDAYNYNPDAVYDDGSCTVLDCTGDQYNGAAVVEFTKTYYGVEQDFISPTVALTRGSQNGLFNALQQPNYNYGLSPNGTQWHWGGVNVPNAFTDWRTALGSQAGGYPRYSLDLENYGTPLMTMRTDAEQWVFEIEFTDWVCGWQCGYGGGFTYIRRFMVEESGCVEVPLVPGCTSANACNYDPAATFDDSSCIFGGCLDPAACNYDPGAPCDDGTCAFTLDCSGVCGGNWWINPCGDCADPDNDPCIGGCTNPEGFNYNPDAVYDDGSCTVLDCTGDQYNGARVVEFTKTNYGAEQDFISPTVAITRGSQNGLFNAVQEGGYSGYFSPSGTQWHNGDVNSPNAFTSWQSAVYQGGTGPSGLDDGVNDLFTMRTNAEQWVFEIDFNDWVCGQWCVDGGGGGFTYTRTFMIEESGCVEIPLVPGCMAANACNYDPAATWDDGSCIFGGCLDPLACNYDPFAACDDGTCAFTLDCSGVCGGAWVINVCGDCVDPDNDPCIGGCMNPEAFNYNPDAVYDDGSCTVLLCDDADYQGGMVVNFVKNSYDDPNTVYDEVYDDLRITRGSQRGLYDQLGEPGGWPYCCFDYPSGTQWKWGDFNSPYSYTNWRSASMQIQNHFNLDLAPNNVMTMYVPAHGTYFEFTFTNWQTNGGGGAVSYTREFLMAESGCVEVPLVPGCNDILAVNFDPLATLNDGSCLYEGCIDPAACNFDPEADFDDGSCIYPSGPIYLECPQDIVVNVNDPEAECAVVEYDLPVMYGICADYELNATLDVVAAQFAANYTNVLAAIPSEYNFAYDGGNNYIGDGGGDMYDGGNYLNTNLGNNLLYTSGVVTPSAAFGGTGAYFTSQQTGLFLMAADMDNVSDFYTSGNVGADGGGTENSFEITGGGFRGFYKQVCSAGDPSVNHLMIVADSPGITQSTPGNTDNDLHTISGLNGTNRIYYLLWAGTSGYCYSNAEVQDLMDAFIGLLPVGNPALLSGYLSGSCFPGGTTEVCYEYTDELNNEVYSCCFNVTVNIEGCTNPNGYNYNPGANIDDGSCTVLVDCDYDGPAEVVFSKAPNADINVFNDPISESVILTRSNNCGARGLYNMVNEGNYITYTSPTGTEWHYGDVNNGNPFTTWRSAVYQSGFGGPYYTYQQPGNVMTMRTTAEQLVFEFRFNTWNNGCGGGSVGYTRTFMVAESGCQEVPLIPGCTDPTACNYDAGANGDDGTCIYGGCMDVAACNYDPNATCDNGSCVYFFDCAGVCGGDNILDACGNCYDPDLLVGQVEFTYTGDVQTWEVPEDGDYTFEAWGAQGGDILTLYPIEGGRGGYAKGTMTLTEGTILNIYVGGAGENRSGDHPYGTCAMAPGGWNGGGNSYTAGNGTGGGGASDIRIGGQNLTDRVIVAGGGGGGGWTYARGGDGGGLTGEDGTKSNQNGTGARGGSQVAGGAVGGGYNIYCNPVASAGTLGQGGTANGFSAGGGGGGGGYYGGGGGGYDDGGGGGSSYIDGLVNAETQTGIQSGDGLVIISFSVAPECLPGCTDPNADNYDPAANFEDGSCFYSGCTDAAACNYDPGATVDDGSCAYVFDCAGVCGGPSVLDACGTCYDPNDLTSVTFNYTGSTQTWQVPDNVTFIRIQAYGGQGGGNNGTEGGLGAYMSGEFTVTPGQQFLILAGGQGESGDGLSEYAGGGGGSFVTDYSYNPWVIAGGGGGSNGGPTNANMHGSTGNSGLDGYSPNSPTNYGVGGSGGAGASNVMGGAACGGNGGGLNSAGEEPLCAIPGTLTSGDSFDNGGAGGTAPCGSGVQGGIGGGGGGGCHGAGGGGGYSGGGGSYGIGGNGGGGGSFNAGDNQNNAGGVNEGNGRVIISFLDIPLCLEGCTNPDADNYDPAATIDDGSCIIGGCMDPAADNYNPDATYDDGGCIYLGCTYPNAINFDPGANTDDGSCLFDTCDGGACGPGTYWDEDLGQCLPEPNTCPEDLTGDGLVNTADLLELLAVFGTVCP